MEWGAAYSQNELADAEERWNIRFPPDLADLYLERRPVAIGKNRFVDWVSDPEDEIRGALEWPFDGFLFDVERNGLWWPEWGERPTQPAGRREVLKAVFDAAPRLVPVFGHRYIPAEPHEPGNPVFSVYQSDVIFYGTDLVDYLEREEFGGNRPWTKTIKPIRFWSLVVERNDDPRWRAPLPVK